MRINDSQHWISKTLESAFNTPEATGSNYSFIPTTEPYFFLPKAEKVNDGGRIGKNAPTHLCNTYWSNPQVSLKDDVETDVPARLFRRALGGSVTDTVVSAGVVYDHTFPILQPQIGDILPSFNIATLLGAASFLLSGMMVESFKVSQKGDERAQYEALLMGSGKFTNPHGLTALPAMGATPCMDAFRTKVTYLDSDGTTTIDFASLGTIIDWMVEHKNNIRGNKRRIGDTIQTVGSNGSAAHVRKMPRGKYETNIAMTVDFVDLTDWTKSVQNQTLTNLKFTVVGPIIATTYRHEFEIIVPSFAFDSVDTADDEGDAATSLNVIAFEDSVTKGTITGRIRNGQATLV